METPISISWREDKQNVVYPYDRILLGNKNEVLIHATKWTQFENIMLNEIIQSQKTTHVWSHLY